MISRRKRSACMLSSSFNESFSFSSCSTLLWSMRQSAKTAPECFSSFDSSFSNSNFSSSICVARCRSRSLAASTLTSRNRNSSASAVACLTLLLAASSASSARRSAKRKFSACCCRVRTCSLHSLSSTSRCCCSVSRSLAAASCFVRNALQSARSFSLKSSISAWLLGERDREANRLGVRGGVVARLTSTGGDCINEKSGLQATSSAACAATTLLPK
mmetsp:Transcript_19005/g.44331  ORF Transcript_19005/g.44331 Transcript_19005/m.44331 type:complete len:217 (-) Transcript_19005:742-1392(-)